jgi:hypothetical protein
VSIDDEGESKQKGEQNAHDAAASLLRSSSFLVYFSTQDRRMPRGDALERNRRRNRAQQLARVRKKSK